MNNCIEFGQNILSTVISKQFFLFTEIIATIVLITLGVLLIKNYGLIFFNKG